ncbi:MAG: hypothetical protein JWP38_496 [Herbaspirillum sp.]|jgi:hypothetical protein|nr:hypothetical protein [Herbaspirillum sp.]
MRNWKAGHLRIGLSKTGMAVLHVSGGWRPRTTVLADRTFTCDDADLSQPMAQQCENILSEIECGGMPVDITLSDDWTRLLMVAPPQNVGRLEDCKAAAAMRFQALYGGGLSDWRLQADWQTARPFLACGLPQTLFETLQQIAREKHFHLVGLTPQFVAIWNRRRKQLKSGAWLGVVHGDTLTLGACARGRLQTVRTAAIPAAADGALWLKEHLKREAMRLNLPAPRLLQLCGLYPPDWINAADAEDDDGSEEEPFACAALQYAPEALNGQPISAHVALAGSGMWQ